MVAEIRYGIQAIDHIAIPVRDLTLNQSFYTDVLGLKFKTLRRNPDGTPRQTYVLAGENIIGLHLPGISAGPSPSAAPRIAIGVSPERLADIQENLRRADHPFRGPVDHSADAPLVRSLYFDDPDGNHLEACVRRIEPLRECISHTVFETVNLKKSLTFYAEALGSGVAIACGGETMVTTQSGQRIGLLEVERLSERSKKHGRGCHMALNVPREDFESMIALIERYGGKPKAISAPTPAYVSKASAVFISLISTTIVCRSPHTRPIRRINCSPTLKSGVVSSPTALSRAAD